jgi:hypothetical protein
VEASHHLVHILIHVAISLIVPVYSIAQGKKEVTHKWENSRQQRVRSLGKLHPLFILLQIRVFLIFLISMEFWS